MERPISIFLFTPLWYYYPSTGANLWFQIISSNMYTCVCMISYEINVLHPGLHSMNWRVLRLTYWTNTKGLIPGPLDKTFYTINYYIQYNNTGGALPQTPPPQFQSTLFPFFLCILYFNAMLHYWVTV